MIDKKFTRNLDMQLVFGYIIVSIYLLPYIIFREDVVFRIHDNLDGEFVNIILVTDQGQYFMPMDWIVKEIMNGLPRSSFISDLNILYFLFYHFDPFTAYLLNLVFIHYIAYFGMYKLLKNNLFENDTSVLPMLISLCFGLLPFYGIIGLTIAGQPLLTNSFVKLYRGNSSKLDLIFLTIMPFYSSLILGLIFYLMVAGFFGIYQIYTSKKMNYNLYFSILYMAILSMIVEYRLLYSIFIEKIVSHRTEFYSKGYSSDNIGSIFYEMFSSGQYHAISLHKFIFFITLILLIPSLVTKEKRHFKFLAINFCISLFYTILNWEIIREQLNQLQLFRMVQFDRFYFLSPMIWVFLFGIVLKICEELISNFNIKKYIPKLVVIFFTMVQLCLILFSASSFYNINYYNTYNNENLITMKDYFDVELFNLIKQEVGVNLTFSKSIALGISPSILLYNSIPTLDGYITNYPLEYKNEFRKIIEKELDKNKDLKEYFDNWGSRVYIVSSEIGKRFLVEKKENVKIQQLELNITQIKIMGGKFLFSTVEILNYNSNEVPLIGKFSTGGSIWEIYLYEFL